MLSVTRTWPTRWLRRKRSRPGVGRLSTGQRRCMKTRPIDAKSDISMNHIMFGEIGAWMYKALGGIRPGPAWFQERLVGAALCQKSESVRRHVRRPLRYDSVGLETVGSGYFVRSNGAAQCHGHAQTSRCEWTIGLRKRETPDASVCRDSFSEGSRSGGALPATSRNVPV